MSDLPKQEERAVLNDAKSKITNVEMYVECLQSEAYRTSKILDEHKLLFKSLQSQLEKLQQDMKIQMDHIIYLESQLEKAVHEIKIH